MSSSSPPPPSYSSHSSARSSGSRKHASGPADRDNKEKIDRRDSTRVKEKRERERERAEGDDEVSIRTKSSSGVSSTGTTSSTQSALDTLRLIAGSGVRRSKCRAEFLEKLAKSPDDLSALDKDVAERLRIVTGKEAVAFFRKFVGEEPLSSGLRSEEELERLKKIMDEPVVFGVCVLAAGRRVVDYYMTWRGKSRTNADDSDPRRGAWDHDFRRVRKSIDHGYQRQTSTRDGDDDTRAHRSDKLKKRPLTPPPHKRNPPPHITISSHDAVPDLLPSPGPPSANDSVISLPFLGAIRNVPLSNRLPLRITNPDRNSIAETSVVAGGGPVMQIPHNASLETLVEAPESAENVAPNPERQDSIDTLVHASDADQKLGVPKDKGYESTISSAGSRSSRSHRSRSHRSRSRKSSSSRKHHELSRSKSDKEHGHSSSRHRDKDHHHHHHHHSSRHHDEKDRRHDHDRSSRKPERKGSSSSRKPLETDITLVMVDPDEVDRESIRAVMKQPPAPGTKAWHGLTVSRRGTKTGASATVARTPWAGPLAVASDGIRNIAPYNLDSDSDSDEWQDVPGIPKRIPVIPPRITSIIDSDTDTESSRSSPRLRSSPPPMEGYFPPAKPETQAIYPRVNQAHASNSPARNANAYTPPPPSHHDVKSVIPIPRGVPTSPQASPYTYGSPSVDHSNLTSPAHTGYGISSPPAFGVVSPVPLSSIYNPGYYVSPTHSTQTISPIGTNATPLPGIHHALTNNNGTMTPQNGSNSPYLYSTPRASPSATLGSPSPYVPAWISPQSTASSTVPLPGRGTHGTGPHHHHHHSHGMMSPTSMRGGSVPLHSVVVPPVGGPGGGGYVPGSRATAPY
ncbi:hypothetical protein NP233_g1635 [Leucocoprinus birnbaumii]|uniref:Uncharacterized protein n=1 Tax=Leucocoprinus birnbaumii TaxID=56174 RepID=A0AAD5VZV3_9AGAR|nr:hypothetical protein NP233_g1635 [Leucocoprinus birnbaumii]